jgi:hypothetical protein
MQRTGGGNPGPDDLDVAGVLDLDPGPEMGTSPGLSSGPGSGRRPRPECRGGASRRGPGRPRAGGCGCPGPPSSCSDVTLSDEVGQGERTRTRRSARSRPMRRCLITTYISGRSGAEALLRFQSGTAGLTTLLAPDQLDNHVAVRRADDFTDVTAESSRRQIVAVSALRRRWCQHSFALVRRRPECIP